MNFVVIIASMTAFWHISSAGPEKRHGKFLGLSSDDMMNDIFDEIYDPFPVASPTNSISVRDYVLKKIKKKTDADDSDNIPPFPIPQQIVQKLAPTMPPPTTTLRPPVKTSTEESIILYDSGNSKFEITPAGFASHPQPITEGMFLIGGQFEQSEKPPNVTDEKLKIFWSSLGDFIESVPFLPIQVNVPDLLMTMAQYFSERFPFLNRHRDESEPRPVKKTPSKPFLEESYQHYLPLENNLLEYRKMTQTTTEKLKKKQKKKGNKKRKPAKRRTEQKGYKLRGNYVENEMQTTSELEMENRKYSESQKAQKHKPFSKKSSVESLTQKVRSKNTTPRSATIAQKKRLQRSTEAAGKGVYSTTLTPVKPTAKAWFQKTTETLVTMETPAVKLFNHNNSPGAEVIRYHNFPITSTRNKWKDREIFNFKDSTLTNSPLTIVNIPQRHVFLYRVEDQNA